MTKILKLLIFCFFFNLAQADEGKMILKLKYGEVVIELYPEIAPQHTKRFKELADSKKYDGEITKSDVELDEMLLSRIETNYTLTSGNKTSDAVNIQFVEKVTKDSLLQCYL